jgi:hypothetical protein
MKITTEISFFNPFVGGTRDALVHLLVRVHAICEDTLTTQRGFITTSLNTLL